MDQKLYYELKEQYGSVIADDLLKKYDITPKPYVLPKVFRRIANTPIKCRENVDGIGGNTEYIKPGEFIEALKKYEGHDDQARECLIFFARKVLPSPTCNKGNNAYTDNGWWKHSYPRGYVEYRPEEWEEYFVKDATPPPVTAPGLR